MLGPLVCQSEKDWGKVIDLVEGPTIKEETVYQDH